MDGPATSNGIGERAEKETTGEKRVGKLHVPGPSTGGRLRLIEHRAPLALVLVLVLVADARERSCLLLFSPWSREQRADFAPQLAGILSWRGPRSPGNTCQGQPAHEGGKFVTDRTKMLRHALGLW